MSTFFKSISQFTPGVDLQINITAGKGDELTVSVFPKKKVNDPAAIMIKPIVVTGTPEEIDAGLIALITEPLQKTSGLLSNIKKYEDSLATAAANTKAEKDKAEKEKKEKEERKKQYETLIKKGENFFKEEKYKDAAGAFKQAKQFTDNPSAVDQKIKEATAKLSQGGLFETFDSAAEPTNYLEAEQNSGSSEEEDDHIGDQDEETNEEENN